MVGGWHPPPPRTGRKAAPTSMYLVVTRGVHSPTPDTGGTEALPLWGLSSKPQTIRAISICSQQPLSKFPSCLFYSQSVSSRLQRAPRRGARICLWWKLLHLTTALSLFLQLPSDHWQAPWASDLPFSRHLWNLKKRGGGYKWTYLQNRNRLTDFENLMVTRSSRHGSAVNEPN